MEAARVSLLKLEVSRCDGEAWIELDPLGLGSEEIQGRDAGTEDRGLLLMVIDNGGEHDRAVCPVKSIHELDIGRHH